MSVHVKTQPLVLLVVMVSNIQTNAMTFDLGLVFFSQTP